MELERYRKATQLLDFEDPHLVRLMEKRGWCALSEYDRIGAIYDFVRDEIALGYNESDAMPASKVLQDGYGQCNTKSILLMALLRKCGIACRLHGFTVHKRLQKGVITGMAYWLAPREIIHSWVEVFHQEEWINLEGFILGSAYLQALQHRFPDAGDTFCGYAVATSHFNSPRVAWGGKDTYIQGRHHCGLKALLYRHVFRQRINRKVASIRNADPDPAGCEQRDKAPC